MKKMISLLLVALLSVTTLSITATAAKSYPISVLADVSKGSLEGGGGRGLPITSCNCDASTIKVKHVSGADVVRIGKYDWMFDVTYKKTGTGIYKLTCEAGHISYLKVIVRPFEVTATFDTTDLSKPSILAIHDWYVNKKTVTVSSSVDGLKVVAIQPKCFSGNDKIEVIKLPKTIKYIEKTAFDGCPNLKKVIVHGKTFTPDTLYKIWLPSTWEDTKHSITTLPERYSIWDEIQDGKVSKALYEYFT